MRRLAAFLAITLCLAAAQGARATELKPAACPPDVDPRAVRCATLAVPLDHAQPAGRSIELYLAVVPAVKAKPGMPPLLVLSGGPGNSNADTAAWYLETGTATYDMRKERPVVLLDQRGTGLSSPLHCPALEARRALARFYPPEQVIPCRDALAAQKDLTQFGTSQAARDLDLVREALGYGQVDLWAVSYGTILAQVFLRDFPRRVRSMVLVGASPIDARFPLYHAANAQRALDLLFFECRSDPACSAAYPQLHDDWQRLLARLESDPPQVELTGREGEPWSGALARDAFGEAFRGLLGSTASQRRVPWIVHEAARGNLSPLLEAIDGPADSAFSTGLYLSVTCAEATARNAPAQVQPAVAGTFLGDYRVREQRTACESWPRAEPEEEFFRPVDSDVPVLLLVGDLDYITPPAWSHQVARRLSRSRVVTMPHGGHLFWDWGDGHDGGACFDRLALEFYARGEARELDTSCAERATAPAFHLPP